MPVVQTPQYPASLCWATYFITTELTITATTMQAGCHLICQSFRGNDRNLIYQWSFFFVLRAFMVRDHIVMVIWEVADLLFSQSTGLWTCLVIFFLSFFLSFMVLYVHRNHRNHQAYWRQGARDGHLDFHTAPELFSLSTTPFFFFSSVLGFFNFVYRQIT